MSRTPFNHKRSSRTMDEPTNVWDKISADDQRWTRRKRCMEFSLPTVIAAVLACAVMIAAFAAIIK